MKNTLNPCKCDSSSGGGSASDILYDGLTVDCVPISPGQNLATVLKNLGDYVCGLEGRTQVVTVDTDFPTGGGEGDIWFRQQGSSITVYQRISGNWVVRGNLPFGGITPTLQQVTDQGNETTLPIEVGGLVSNGDVDVIGTITADEIQVAGNAIISGQAKNSNAPVSGEDLTNKDYVDGAISAIPTPPLQSVTDEGNQTTNAIQVTGQGNADLTQQSLVLSNQGAASQVSHASGGSAGGTLLMTDSDARIATGTATTDNGLFVGPAFSEFRTNASVLTVARGADAVGDDDFVTKRQLDAGGSTTTIDPSLPSTPTLTYLNTNYPDANVGDKVVRESTNQVLTATCYATDKWSWTLQNRAL